MPAAAVYSVRELDSVPYRESSDDTLIRIAKVHGTTVKALKSANGLNGDRLLSIPNRLAKFPACFTRR
jgi:LysM repeat protein